MDSDSEALVSEQTRLSVWRSLYDQERLVRYYERLHRPGQIQWKLHMLSYANVT